MLSVNRLQRAFDKDPEHIELTIDDIYTLYINYEDRTWYVSLIRNDGTKLLNNFPGNYEWVSDRKSVTHRKPDAWTRENIASMVNRQIELFSKK